MSAVDIEVPTSPKDAINRAILEVSEDQIKGFSRNPIGEIAKRAGLPVETVIERIQAMSAPCARFVARSVWRTRRTVPSRSMA